MFPEISEFINQETSKLRFENFSVQYIGGQYPVLEVTKSDGSLETIAIDAWKIPDLEEFLSTSLGMSLFVSDSHFLLPPLFPTYSQFFR